MKRFLIQLADYFDDYILKHRSYKFCCWVGQHSWWDAANAWTTCSQQAQELKQALLKLEQTLKGKDHGKEK